MKPRFSFEKHQEVGKELKKIRDYLVWLSVEVGTAYPKTERVSRQAFRAHEAVDKLRSLLDDCFCEEYPYEDEQGVYFGQSVK